MRIALLLLALLPAPAMAAELYGEGRLVSDHRFRGLSRSNAEPAVQASLDLEAGDVRAGVFASSLSGAGRPPGAGAELTLSAGYTRPLGLGSLDLGLTLYNFPGADHAASVIEAQAALSRTIGPLHLTAGAAWAPSQAGLALRSGAHASSLYGWGSARLDVPGTPMSLSARLGHTRGALIGGRALAGTARAWDWKLGMDYAAGPFTIGAALAGTDLGQARAQALGLNVPGGRNLAGTGLVLSIAAGF